MRRSLMTLLPMTHEDKKTILIVDDNASVGRFAAGVLAGDVWKYFGLNGNKIWTKFDASGLLGTFDPHLDIDDPAINGPPCVATFRERLAELEPSKISATVMLQGYYKRFLRNESNENLISFGSPHGRLGVLGIVNGSHWKVYQLPD